MSYITITAQTHNLGWSHTDLVTPKAFASIDSHIGYDAFLSRFSSQRKVFLESFSVSKDCIRVADLYDFDEDLFDGVSSLSEACDAVDCILALRGQRVATEDELEAAMGAGLFPWGDELPDGVPYGKLTEFKGHLRPSRSGLNYNASTYAVEITRTALKLGDGGAAVCGGDPWPIAWMSLCPSFRLLDKDIDGCLAEFLEDAEVRPVKLG